MNEPGSAMRRMLLSRSAAIFLIRIFPAAATAGMLIACAHVLPRELNGLYQRLWLYIAVLMPVAAIGLPALVLTHPPEVIDQWLAAVRKRQGLALIMWVGLLSVVTGILFIKSLFPPVVVAVLFYTQTVVLLLESYLIVQRKFGLAATGSIIYAILYCLLHYLLLRGRISFPVLIGSIAIISGARALVFALVLKRNLLAQKAQSERMPYAIRQQWVQLGIYDVSQIVFKWIDKLIVSFIVGPGLFAVYLVGTTDVPLLPLLLGAVGNALLQQLAFSGGSTDDRSKLARYSGDVLGRIVFPLFFFLVCFRAEFISVFFGKKYEDAVPLFLVSSLVLPLRAYNYTAMLQHLNKVRLVNLGALLDLGLALALCWPLFHFYGLIGVAIACALSPYAQALFYLLATARLLKCSVADIIPWKQWGVMLIVFGFIAIGLHELLACCGSIRQTLLLGFMATSMVVGMALAPLILRGRAHGKV